VNERNGLKSIIYHYYNRILGNSNNILCFERCKWW